MSQLSLANVINISVSAAQAGVGNYNTSNLAVFTEEVAAGSFGTDGFKIYLDPSEVATDFGTGSKTFAMANAIFSQAPNILAGGGYLVVIPMLPEVQSVTLSGTPASGTFLLNFGGNPVATAIQWSDNAAAIQTKVRTIPGLEGAVVTGTLAGGLSVKFSGYYGDAALMTVTSNSLATSGPVAITVTVAQVTAGEVYAAAITRTAPLVQYFGLLATLILDQASMLAAAAVIQPLNKIGAVVSETKADAQAGGALDLLRSGGFTQCRGLYYGGDTDIDTLVFMAAYMSRGLSTNFEGSNTTSTLHLKDLTGVQPDLTVDQTLLEACKTSGADLYVSLQGVPKIFCSGANKFFDQIYNLRWFVGALQVAGFNFLAESATKVPQTEQGMDGLKNAYGAVCDQAVTNQYLAPGAWKSSTTFGNQADFLANIQQLGYYLFSQPLAKQSQASREARQAPLVQIAVKEAGAIHESSVVIYVNA